jgi:O-antigen biosynthesis protein WbqP
LARPRGCAYNPFSRDPDGFGGRAILKRALDIAGGLVGLVLLSPLFLGLAIAVRLESPGPALHWSKRVGRRNRIFPMPKFRTMRTGAPDVATHLLDDPDQWVTPLGAFLRRSSLDELPQLWSVLKGDMSLVGPRPALFNQDDLVALRTAAGVDALRPGLTGWAQINGRDELPVRRKAELDAEYLERMSLAFDLRILLVTARTALSGRGVTH